VQAGVTAYLLDKRPDSAREALVTIEQTSAQAVNELTAMAREAGLDITLEVTSRRVRSHGPAAAIAGRNGAPVSTAAASTSGPAPIKVLLADDQALVRSGFKLLLDAEPDITVVGEQVRVLILTTYDTDAYVFEALQAGASGFLLKDAGPAASAQPPPAPTSATPWPNSVRATARRWSSSPTRPDWSAAGHDHR
jgi:hypothetical protein